MKIKFTLNEPFFISQICKCLHCTPEDHPSICWLFHLLAQRSLKVFSFTMFSASARDRSFEDKQLCWKAFLCLLVTHLIGTLGTTKAVNFVHVDIMDNLNQDDR